MITFVRDLEVIAERMGFTSCRELGTEKLLCLGAIELHQVCHVRFAIHIKRVYRITFFRKSISGQLAWQYLRLWSISILAISEFTRN